MKTEHAAKPDTAAHSALKTKIIENFGTPCAVVDLDVVEQNIKRAQKLCDDAGVLLSLIHI